MPDQPAPLLSRSQIRKLGSRLRKPDPPTVEDLELLERVRVAYGQILDDVVRTLFDHGLPSTGRLKTTRTIVEKLRRNPSMGLLTMQDIAGTRIVAEMDRDEQDGMVERLMGLLQNAEIVDRRANPSFGYRAVHVIAREQGYPVEIQVRTGLQNAWAQVFERLADVVGRQIRYGEPLDDPDEEFAGGLTRQRIVDFFMGLSEAIDLVEARIVMTKKIEHQIEEHMRQLQDAKGQLQDAKDKFRAAEAELRDFFGQFGPLAQAPATFRRQPE